AIKRAIDGALGPRDAWLLAPYADKPDDTGRNTTPVAEIAETARLALEHGYQLCVHAIGDRANRETLDIFRSEKPDDTGRNTTPVAEIAETARLALEHGYQLCVHAIGDRANRETLDIF